MHHQSLEQLFKIYIVYRYISPTRHKHYCNREEMRSRNISSLQGMVKPPIGWLNPNSSSARLRNSLKEGWFRNDIGTTNLFFSFSICSPTYTATCPLGTLSNDDDDVRFLFPSECSFIICFAAFVIAIRLNPILVIFCYRTKDAKRNISMKVFFLGILLNALRWRKVVMIASIYSNENFQITSNSISVI